MKCSLKWRPIMPVRRQDKIVSSDSRMRGDTMGFLPSYETEATTNMFHLMSNEFQRKWTNEKKVYDKINYAQVQTYLEESAIRRRFVQRDLRRRIVEKRLPIIKLKQFQNIPSKTDHKWKKSRKQAVGDKPEDKKETDKKQTEAKQQTQPIPGDNKKNILCTCRCVCIHTC